MKKLVLLVPLALAMTATIHAAGGIPLWTNRYDGPANGIDSANAIAVDASGNVVVTGYSTGNGSGDDYATIKYSNTGVPLWTNRYNGPANGADYAYAIAVDGSENVFVTGTSAGNGYATIKYSSAGVPLWTNRYKPMNSGASAAGITVDGSGNVFVTGSSYDGVGGYADYLTIKYSGAGVPLWTNRYNGPLNDADNGQRVAVDGAGNAIVTGFSVGIGGSGYDFATIKYSTSGVPLWTNRYNGSRNAQDYVNAIAVDSGGNSVVCGYSQEIGSEGDFTTIKYSASGMPLWTNRYNGSANGEDFATAVVVDGSGNIVVTGSSRRNGTEEDSTTIKYSGAGVPLWTNFYNGPENGRDDAHAIAVDTAGTVFVTGESRGSNSSTYVTIAYSEAGVPLWTNRYNGPSNGYDTANAISLDTNGNVFVTGKSKGNGSDYDYTTIKYSSSLPPPIRLDFQVMNNQLRLSWTNASYVLQTAPTVPGTFTNIPGATSPHTNALTSAQQFFRLISN